jgi:hypothetical protein
MAPLDRTYWRDGKPDASAPVTVIPNTGKDFLLSRRGTGVGIDGIDERCIDATDGADRTLNYDCAEHVEPSGLTEN